MCYRIKCATLGELGFRAGAWLVACLLGLFATDSHAAAPVNDNFGNSKLLTGGSGVVFGENTLATSEGAEPEHAASPASKSLWYVWHCSSGGTLSLSLTDATLGFAMAVYTGQSIESLAPVAAVRNTSLSLSLVPGTVYRIAVDGLEGGAGTFSLRWKQTLLLGKGPDLTVPIDLIQLKVVEQSFPASDCEVTEHCIAQGKRRLLRFDMHTVNLGTEDLVFGPPGNSPMFQYAPCHNHYHFEALAAYRVLTLSNEVVRVGNKFGFCLEDVLNSHGPAGAAKIYSCDFQGIQAGWSDIYNADLPCQYVDLTGLPVGDYQLEIELDPLHQIPESDEENNRVRVPFYLPAVCTGPPANDAFLSAQPIQGSIATVLGDTSCATRQNGEPTHSPDDGGIATKSIWFSWIAPDNRPADISTEGSSFDTVLAVYEGEVNPKRLANNNDISLLNRQSRVGFTPVAGRKYFIAVDGSEQSEGVQSGLVVLSVNPSGNDFLETCLPISGTAGSVLGSILRATIDEGEPVHAGQGSDASVWFCWTAPHTGFFTFDTVGSSFDTLLALYSGESLEVLTPVASDDELGGVGTSRLAFEATSGSQYRVAVARRKTDAPVSSGVFRLSWRDGSPQAPVIVTQPRSVTTFAGSNAVLSVSARGSLPLTYQWFQGVSALVDSQTLQGATSPTLQFTPLQESDRGVYKVRVSNPVTQVESDSVNVVVATPNRVVFIEPMNVTSGSAVGVGVSIAARGGENALQFSVSYDATLMQVLGVDLAQELPVGSAIQVDASQGVLGWIGVRVQLPAGLGLIDGNRHLVVISFQLANGLLPEQRLSLCFDDQPFSREARGGDGGLLTSLYACGNLFVSEQNVLSGRFNDQGLFELTLQGVAGATYEFQYSEDLQTWTLLANEINPSGMLVVTDNAHHNLGRCFYRAIRR